jgi:mediator of RNA polymerase II transcription subunit 13
MRRSSYVETWPKHTRLLTNVQGDFEAVAYQAFSVARNTTQPSETLRDWSPSEDTRAVEAFLRDRQLFVARDATRPWLWLFSPTTVDKAGASPAALPEVEGYSLQRTCSNRLRPCIAY